jgi:hypothetical protein
LSGYQVDDALELHGLLHREVCRLDVLKDLIDGRASGAADGAHARRMGKKCAWRHLLLPVAREWQALLSG